MPRPSDLYATLGAPGVYQSTSCTPTLLPTVFVIPPAEDNQDVHCLFHSGSASLHEPFSREFDHPQQAPTTLTNMTVLDQALSFMQHQASASIGAPLFGPRTEWDRGGRVMMSRRNIGTAMLPNLSFLVDEEEHLQLQKGENISSRPASRRSSVFGERPSDYEILQEAVSAKNEGGMVGAKKSQNMTFKRRATMALKAITRGKVKKSENQVHSAAEGDIIRRQSLLSFEEKTMPVANSKQPQRSTHPLLLGYNRKSSPQISATSLTEAEFTFSPTATLPRPPTPHSGIPKLTKRKSMTRFFGYARNPSEGTNDELVDGLDSPARLSLSSPEPRLPKRKSTTQLFGIGRRASVTQHPTVTWGQGDDTQSLYSPPPPPQHLLCHEDRRKSLCTERRFSFLDLHRHFSSQLVSRKSRMSSTAFSTSSVTSCVPDTPSPSEETESPSSTPPSILSDPETEDEARLFAPRVTLHSPCVRDFTADKHSAMELTSIMRPDTDGKDVLSWYDLHAPVNFAFEGDGKLSPELEARLDVLSFDQLSFDLESFAIAAQT